MLFSMVQGLHVYEPPCVLLRHGAIFHGRLTDGTQQMAAMLLVRTGAAGMNGRAQEFCA